MAEEDGVDLGDCVGVAVENSNRPWGSTDEPTRWFARSSGRLKVVGVEGGVSSGAAVVYLPRELFEVEAYGGDGLVDRDPRQVLLGDVVHGLEHEHFALVVTGMI
jgi:hypothetical protein